MYGFFPVRFNEFSPKGLRMAGAGGKARPSAAKGTRNLFPAATCGACPAEAPAAALDKRKAEAACRAVERVAERFETDVERGGDVLIVLLDQGALRASRSPSACAAS